MYAAACKYGGNPSSNTVARCGSPRVFPGGPVAVDAIDALVSSNAQRLNLTPGTVHRCTLQYGLFPCLCITARPSVGPKKLRSKYYQTRCWTCGRPDRVGNRETSGFGPGGLLTCNFLMRPMAHGRGRRSNMPCRLLVWNETITALQRSTRVRSTRPAKRGGGTVLYCTARSPSPRIDYQKWNIRLCSARRPVRNAVHTGLDETHDRERVREGKRTKERERVTFVMGFTSLSNEACLVTTLYFDVGMHMAIKVLT